MFKQNKIEVIQFKDFMSLPALPKKEKPLTTNICSFLPVFSLKSAFPLLHDSLFTVFIGSCTFVLLMVLSENILENLGFYEASDMVSSTLKFILPIAGFSSLIWFVISL